MDLQPGPPCGIMMKACCWATADELGAVVADELARTAGQARVNPFALMLAGGTTPLAAYRQLADAPTRLPPDMHVLFSDDRHVPPDSPHSNFGQVRPMLANWGLPPERILHVRGELPLAEATVDYGRQLQAFLNIGGTVPLGLLGLGTDGHTASLFTAAQVHNGQESCTLAVARPDGLNGITVTPRFLRQVQRILFVVTGRNKRAVAEQLIRHPSRLPAGQAVAGHRCVEVWMDREAWPL